MSVEDVIARLKMFVENSGSSLGATARGSGLHPNSLLRLYDPVWRPRLDTCLKIQRFLDQAEREKPIIEVPTRGDGWEIVHDHDGFWILLDEGDRALGPYSSLRRAATDAFLPAGKRTRVSHKEGEIV